MDRIPNTNDDDVLEELTPIINPRKQFRFDKLKPM